MQSFSYDHPHLCHSATLHSTPAVAGGHLAAAALGVPADSFLAFAAEDVIAGEAFAAALDVLDVVADAYRELEGGDLVDQGLADEAKDAAGAFLGMDADSE